MATMTLWVTARSRRYGGTAVVASMLSTRPFVLSTFLQGRFDGGCKGSLLSLGEGRLRRSKGVEACGLWP